jgi:hypothetical protein
MKNIAVKCHPKVAHRHQLPAVLFAIIGAVVLGVIGLSTPAVAATPATAIVHGVPRVPLAINGNSVAPQTITQYNGQPLYMAVLPGGSPRGHLEAFTGRADFEHFVSKHGGPQHALAKPKQMPSSPDKAVAPHDFAYAAFIYDDYNISGQVLGVPTGYGYANLRNVGRSCAFNICIGNWNDVASSALADTPQGEMLWADINWGGSTLWIASRYYSSDLSYFGWDDRTSSFAAY